MQPTANPGAICTAISSLKIKYGNGIGSLATLNKKPDRLSNHFIFINKMATIKVKY